MSLVGFLIIKNRKIFFCFIFQQAIQFVFLNLNFLPKDVFGHTNVKRTPSRPARGS